MFISQDRFSRKKHGWSDVSSIDVAILTIAVVFTASSLCLLIDSVRVARSNMIARHDPILFPLNAFLCAIVVSAYFVSQIKKDIEDSRTPTERYEYFAYKANLFGKENRVLHLREMVCSMQLIILQLQWGLDMNGDDSRLRDGHLLTDAQDERVVQTTRRLHEFYRRVVDGSIPREEQVRFVLALCKASEAGLEGPSPQSPQSQHASSARRQNNHDDVSATSSSQGAVGGSGTGDEITVEDSGGATPNSLVYNSAASSANVTPNSKSSSAGK